MQTPSRRFNRPIRIIAAILVITFIAQDITWANPDFFSERKPRNNKVAVESFLKLKDSGPKASVRFIDVLIQRLSGKEKADLTLDDVKKAVRTMAEQDHEWLQDNGMVCNIFYDEVLINFSGYTLRYFKFDPLESNIKKYRNKRVMVSIPVNRRELLYEQLFESPEAGKTEPKEQQVAAQPLVAEHAKSSRLNHPLLRFEQAIVLLRRIEKLMRPDLLDSALRKLSPRSKDKSNLRGATSEARPSRSTRFDLRRAIVPAVSAAVSITIAALLLHLAYGGLGSPESILNLAGVAKRMAESYPGIRRTVCVAACIMPLAIATQLDRSRVIGLISLQNEERRRKRVAPNMAIPGAGYRAKGRGPYSPLRRHELPDIEDEPGDDVDHTNPFLRYHISAEHAFELDHNTDTAKRIRRLPYKPTADKKSQALQEKYAANGLFKKMREAKEPGRLAMILSERPNFRNLTAKQRVDIIEAARNISISVIAGCAVIGNDKGRNILCSTRTGFSEEIHGLKPTMWLGEILLNKLSAEDLAQLLLEECQHIVKPGYELPGGRIINDHGVIAGAEHPEDAIEHDGRLISRLLSIAKVLELQDDEFADNTGERFRLNLRGVEAPGPITIEILRRSNGAVVGTMEFGFKTNYGNGNLTLDLGVVDIRADVGGVNYQDRGISSIILSLVSNAVGSNSELHISSLEEPYIATAAVTPPQTSRFPG
ncbi:MAG: hypothetical protein PHT32_03340, partial [Candidatus Omnitrophica bacterium]|nr:hypothetical protein [Candidatus Omnitrophota bacterium]